VPELSVKGNHAQLFLRFFYTAAGKKQSDLLKYCRI
jgi:hypothetical protein